MENKWNLSDILKQHLSGLYSQKPGISMQNTLPKIMKGDPTKENDPYAYQPDAYMNAYQNAFKY